MAMMTLTSSSSGWTNASIYQLHQNHYHLWHLVLVDLGLLGRGLDGVVVELQEPNGSGYDGLSYREACCR